MNSRDRIGIFDSGFGGLTVMKKIKEKCPSESIVYFGDTARVPYGGKSPETIVRYSIESAIFLMEQQIKVLVIACNTSAAYSVDRLRNIFNIPVIEVIGPGAERAVSVTRTGKIAVLGTKATILSGAYQREISKRLPSARIYPIYCPLFVPLCEEKFIDHPATKLIVQEYLKEIKNTEVDTVLLGCTHYPVLAALIQEEMGPAVTIVDSASTCADHLAELLYNNALRSSSEPQDQFYVSDDPDKFKLIGEHFLGEKILNCELFANELQSV